MDILVTGIICNSGMYIPPFKMYLSVYAKHLGKTFKEFQDLEWEPDVGVSISSDTYHEVDEVLLYVQFYWWLQESSRNNKLKNNS